MAYYPNYFTPQTYQPQTYQPQNNGLIWVQGEAGAKSYVTPPNTPVLLMDSEKPRFFIKTADPSGMPMPLRVFEYKEVFEQTEAAPDYDKYVTKDELEAKLAELLPKPKKEAPVDG